MVAAVQTVGAAILPGCLGYRGLSRRGIGRHSLDFGFEGGARRGTLLIGADSFPRISNPCFPSASRAFDVALPDRRASFSSFVFSMPHLIHANWDRGLCPIQSVPVRQLSNKSVSFHQVRS